MGRVPVEGPSGVLASPRQASSPTAGALAIGAAPTESGNTGDIFIVRSDGTIHRFAPTEISLRAWGAVGDGTADDTVPVNNWHDAILNSAAGGKIGKAETGTYKITSAVGIYTPGGAGTAGGGSGAFHIKGDPGATFVWAGGASSGNAFFYHSCQGIIEGLNFSFSNVLYDGNLVDVDWGANPSDPQVKFRDCEFGVRTCQTPRCMLRLNRAIISEVTNCHFYGGQYSVLLGDGNYCIANTIRGCAFNNSAIAHIFINGGSNESNLVDACTFEPRADGSPGAVLCNSGLTPTQFTVSNSWFGDTNVVGAQLTVTTGIFTGNRFFGSGSAFKLLANNGVVIDNNTIACDTTFTADSVAMVGEFKDNFMVLGTSDAANSGNAFFTGRNADTTGYYEPSIPGIQAYRPTAEGVSTKSLTRTAATGIVGYQAHAQLAGFSNSNLGAVGFGSGGGIILQPGVNDGSVTVRNPAGTNVLSIIHGGGVDQFGVFDKAPSSTAGQQTADSGSVISKLVNYGWLSTSSFDGYSANNQGGTTYTTVLADALLVIESTNAGASTFTVPPNSSVAYPIGSVLRFYSAGAGGLTVAGGGGVTVRGNTAIPQFSPGAWRKRATNEWVPVV